MKYCNILTVFALVILTMYNPTKSLPSTGEPRNASVDNEDVIIQGIKAGSAVAEFLKEGDFGKTLQSIATNLSPFLGVLGPLASLAFSFIPTEDSAELIFMREEFGKVNTKLDIITSEFEEVKNAIDWNAVVVSYGTYERNIEAANTNLGRVYEHEGSVRENERQYFITQFDNDFSNSLQKLYDAIMNDDHVFSTNILVAVVEQTKRHRRNFEQFTLGLVRLLVQGIKVKLSYYGLKNHSSQHLVDEWDVKMVALKNRLREVSNEIKDTYLTQLRTDAENIILRSTDLGNEDLMLKVYNFVNEKYDWRYFFVAVYNNLEGGDKHFASVCGGHTFFDFDNKNMVIASQDKSLKDENHENPEKETLMDSVLSDARRCRAGLKEKYLDRSKALVLNVLGKVESKCSPNQLYLAMKIHDGFYSRNPNGHRALRQFTDHTECDCSSGFKGSVCTDTYWKHLLMVFG